MISDKAWENGIKNKGNGHYICVICEYDRFHINVDGGKEFVSCANCGVRTDIQITRDGSELKLAL